MYGQYLVEREWAEDGEYYFACDECDFEGDVEWVGVGYRSGAWADVTCPGCGWVSVGVEVRGDVDG